MKRLFLLILALSVLLLPGCSKPKEIKYQASFLNLFDTVTTIVGYAESKEEFTALSQQIYDRLKEYHELYDIYNTYEGVNNIKTVNDSAGKEPVVVDGRILSMLEFAKAQYEATGGAVNVAMGAVLSIWHDYREAGLDDPENAKLPPMDQLTQASQHCSIDDVVIDTQASTVFLKDPFLLLDVGAIAKGYAVEQVALYLEGQGVSNLLLSVGGNVRAIGGNKGDSWKIGIQNPNKSDEKKELMTVKIDELSVVSSGVYERYYTVDGVPYHHIINPDTLMPATFYSQVTILCPDSGLADALSTAVFNMPLEEGKALIESLPDTEALWVFADGTMEYSSGFSEYVK